MENNCTTIEELKSVTTQVGAVGDGGGDLLGLGGLVRVAVVVLVGDAQGVQAGERPGAAGAGRMPSRTACPGTRRAAAPG